MKQEEPTINGKPATSEQFQRVLLLQEKKRRIQAEAQLLVHEERAVDSELEMILSMVEAGSGEPAVSTAAPSPAGVERAAAGLFKRPGPTHHWQLYVCPFLTRPGRLGTQPPVL